MNGFESIIAKGIWFLVFLAAMAPANLQAADTPPITVFMKDAGWCWYQDPRAIVHDGKLLIGAVQGNGSGPAQVGVYDLDAGKPLGSVVMQDNFDRDDHNSPVFHVRADGSILAVYAKHHREACFYTRTSQPGDPLAWNSEVAVTTNHKVTYANLYYLATEKTLYNFYRGIQFNPTYVTSADDGNTWSSPVHFIASELEGTQRPYGRYASHGTDTVHVSFTDGHPRNFGNSIYYAAFRAGKFWKADGALIKDLAKNGPLRPSEAERIYQGSGQPGIDRSRSAPNSAWTSATALDGDGHPHIAYTVYLSNTDHRYRIASWTGAQWIDREVAYAGNCLYDRESSYTGLISLDPIDPTYVVISSDVDPRTGEAKGLHEIYRAQITLADSTQTIHWEALTSDSPVRNLRPVILRDGKRRITLWNRGRFKTFSDYELDAVGIVESPL